MNLPEKLGFGKFKLDMMFYAEFNNTWTSGQLIPLSDISLSPFSNVLHYSQEIFEGMKILKNPQDNQVYLFREKDHYQRFCRSAIRMNMPIINEEIFMKGLESIKEYAKDIIPAEIGKSLYLRPFMISVDDDLKIKESATYKFFIIGTFIDQYVSNYNSVYIEPLLNRSFDNYTGDIKCGGNYGASFFANHKAKENKCQQILWLSPDKKIIDELSVMNIFFVKNKTLLTPKLNGRILPGITRDSIIKIAEREGYTVIESDLNVSEILQDISNGIIEESFATGTASTLFSIDNFNYLGINYPLSNKKIGDFLKNELLQYQHKIKTNLF